MEEIVCVYICTSAMRPNQKIGAYSYALEAVRMGRSVFASGPYTAGFGGDSPPMSRNEAELTALIKAIERFHDECEITVYTHCAYTYNCLKNRWPQKWRNDGWRLENGGFPAHQEKWERYLELTEGFTVKVSMGVYGMMSRMLDEVNEETERQRKISKRKNAKNCDK